MVEREIIFAKLFKLKVKRDIIVVKCVLPIEVGVHVGEDETAELDVFSIGNER